MTFNGQHSPKNREFRNKLVSLTVEPDVVKMDYLSDICLSVVTIITVDIVLNNENIYSKNVEMPKNDLICHFV